MGSVKHGVDPEVARELAKQPTIVAASPSNNDAIDQYAQAELHRRHERIELMIKKASKATT